MRKIVLFFIYGYQRFISPLLGPHCRFYPTCSEYAKQAIESHGMCRGGYLATKRCLKCHPFNEGGIDPVPPTGSAGHSNNAGNQA